MRFLGVLDSCLSNSFDFWFEKGCWEVEILEANLDLVLWELAILKDRGSFAFEEA